jgi:hypothetical protein
VAYATIRSPVQRYKALPKEKKTKKKSTTIVPQIKYDFKTASGFIRKQNRILEHSS